MDKVTFFPKTVCAFCKKREATLMCDEMTGTIETLGHPPRVGGKPVENWEMKRIIHCDKPMCSRCATHITGMDVCPRCLAELKAVLSTK